MSEYHFPESRKHNLEVELARYAAYTVGDRFETNAGDQIEVTDFAYRFGADEFVYWTDAADDPGPLAESSLGEWTRVHEAERDDHIDPGFEEASRSDDPEGDDPADDELGSGD